MRPLSHDLGFPNSFQNDLVESNDNFFRKNYEFLQQAQYFYICMCPWVFKTKSWDPMIMFFKSQFLLGKTITNILIKGKNIEHSTNNYPDPFLF